MTQKDESCDACERLLPCGPARGDVQYLILCKGKQASTRHTRGVTVSPRTRSTTRLGAGVAVRRRAARRGVRWARRRRGDAAISEHPPASGSRPDTCERKEGIL